MAVPVFNTGTKLMSVADVLLRLTTKTTGVPSFTVGLLMLRVGLSLSRLAVLAVGVPLLSVPSYLLPVPLSMMVLVAETLLLLASVAVRVKVSAPS